LVVRFPKTRIYRNVEPKWVSEYCNEFYPHAICMFRVPLGAIPPELARAYGYEKARGLFYPHRPKVDAIVVDKTAMILIEAKIIRYIDGLSKLPVYAALVKHTPELQKWLPRPIIKRLLVAVIPHWLLPIAKELNVEIVNWAPDWVKRIWAERDKYWTPEAEMERERRKEILRKIGFY